MSDYHDTPSGHPVTLARAAFTTTVGEENLHGLQLGRPWFSARRAVVELWADDGQAVEVSVTASDHSVRTGPFAGGLRRGPSDAEVAAALGLGIPEGARVLEQVTLALHAGLDAVVVREAQLERNSTALQSGLNQLARRHEQHVALWYEDAEVFGIGCIVLYPTKNSRSRFTIEEEYAEIDWSAPDRPPTSWAWAVQRMRRDHNGAWHWVAAARGNVDSDEFAQLLEHAHAWVRRIASAPDNEVPVARLSITRKPPTGPQL